VSRTPRNLSDEEAALWARVARTVKPLAGQARSATPPMPRVAVRVTPPGVEQPQARPARTTALPRTASAQPLGAHGLDTGWDRKLARGQLSPDYTLDLHGCTLDTAHSRLLHGLHQARAMGARVVLLVTGRPRPADPADRMSRRGAIRAKVIDWLAASDHASDIAAIRGAHPRHGGQGALYIVLKRRRT
jgi:DNA-nicking Smr family endonuclease